MSMPQVLFLAANPKSTTQLALASECAAIMRVLREDRNTGEIDFQTRWAVTIDDLMRELNALRPSIIHFSGHGNAAGIALEDKERGPLLVPPTALAELLESTETTAQAVILNACYSEAQAQVLSEKLGCAIGMDGAIDDDAALEFSVALYRALGHGKSLHSAFRQARAALTAKHLDHLASPRCLTRSDIDASEIVLAWRREPASDKHAQLAPRRETVPSTTITNKAGRDIIRVKNARGSRIGGGK